MEETYKSAGVNIDAGEKTVERIKQYAKSTFNKNVLSQIGLFGGFYKIPITKYKNPVLVSSVDGVGTKLKIAIASKKYNSIGQDLVNHCVNDIAVCGAKPLFFLDYLAFGKLNSAIAEEIIKGFSIACKENKLALIGGETAEMPGLYEENDFDISGTIVGIAEKKKLIDGKKISNGNILIGFYSNGLHTNGYSLVRKVLFPKYSLQSEIEILNTNLEKELLKVHKSYLKLITTLNKKISINGFAHITGGGIIGNTKRIIPAGLKLKINWNSWQVPQIFRLIQKEGNISDNEMRKVFNMGIGLVAVVSKKNVGKVLSLSKKINEEGIIIGEVISK